MRSFTPILFTFSICCGIILSVEHLNVNGGETIKLRCLLGSKVEDITWLGPPDLMYYAIGYDVNKTLTSITVHNCDTCPNSGPYLEIRNSSEEMEGLYICYGNNNTQQRFHLMLKRKPTNLKIITTTNDGKIIGKEGNELSIVCTVSRGQPGGNLSWSANGEILAVGGPDNVTYTLSPQRKQDNTTYICTAYTSEGHLCLEDSVQLIMYYIPNVTITALPTKTVTEGDSLRLQLHHDSNAPDPKFVWSRNGAQLIETGLLLSLTKVHRNDTGEYMCTLISERGNGTGKISVMINYAPDVHITQSKIDNNSYELKCNPFGNPNNFTFYDWEHLSETGQHIRFIGEASETINVTSEHSYCNSGAYKCNVSNGISNSNGNLFQTATHTLKLEGKPYFLPSTQRKQYGILGYNITLNFDLYCFPLCTNVSIQQNGTAEDLPWNSIHGRYKLTNTYAVVTDTIYGSLIDVNATRIRITLVNIRAADFDNITVEVRNTNGSAWFDLVLASARDPQSTIRLYISCSVMVVILVITVIAMVVRFKGIRATPCNSFRLQSVEPTPQNELQEIHQYDEIDISVFSPPNEITTPHIIQHTESKIELPSTNSEFNEVVNDNQVKSAMCLSEMDEVFKTRPSSLSTNSSDISYLSPCGQYTELKEIRTTSNGVQNYEEILHVRNDFEPNLAVNSDQIHQC